jgi:hypothetical protein
MEILPDRPVFLVGCGRSGTTILGQTLGQHPAVTYLEEPREIWEQVYPETDIWSDEAPLRNGRLFLDGSDGTEAKNALLRRLFSAEIVRAGRPQLLEKLPENCFRMGLIRRIYPEARFLHIIRNGVEVAASISRACRDSKLAGPEWPDWYGVNDYKWERLVAYAQQSAPYCELPALCASDFDRGLLEWRLSVEAAKRFFARLPVDDYLEVYYEELLRDAVAMLLGIQAFIGVPISEQVHDFARDKIERRSPEQTGKRLSPAAKKIGGDLLRRLGYAR